MKPAFATLAATLLGSLILPPTLPAQRVSADGGAQTFSTLADQYFSDVLFRYSPTFGTQSGFHQYDVQLEDYSAAAVQKNIAALHSYESKITAIPADSLDASVAADREILLNSIRSELLSLETIRNWEKDPDSYSSGITNSVFVLMERPFAPVNTRLKAAVARERLMPAVFTAARQNLKTPPRIFTEIALEQIDGIISFFQTDVPEAFKDATDKQALSDFAASNTAVIHALENYRDWLKSDLLPRSTGDYRLGSATFARKLSYDEMVDVPLPHLLEIAYTDLHRNQAEFGRCRRGRPRRHADRERPGARDGARGPRSAGRARDRRGGGVAAMLGAVSRGRAWTTGPACWERRHASASRRRAGSAGSGGSARAVASWGLVRWARGAWARGA